MNHWQFSKVPRDVLREAGIAIDWLRFFIQFSWEKQFLEEKTVPLYPFLVPLQALQHPLWFPGHQEKGSSGMAPVCHLIWHLCL